MPRDRTWSKVIEEHGVMLRLFERANGRAVYLEYRREDGSKVRQTTRTTKRKKAELVAKAVALELAEDRLTGRAPLPTLAQVFKLYETLRLPDLSEAWQKTAKTRLKMFSAAWNGDMRADDVSQAGVDRYVKLRSEGAIAPGHNRKQKAVQAGTVDNDLRWLSSVFNFATHHRVNGKRFLQANPLHDVKWPKEKNIKRPVASHQRYLKTLEHVDAVDPTGTLRCILHLARLTGRRESAICKLKAGDVLRDADAIRAALAEMGFDENRADYMPHGAIRWIEANDKQGFATIAPLGKKARQAVDEYLFANPRVGDAWLFPSPEDDAQPVRRDLAGKWLVRAEKLAKLPKLHRGTWHPYRRLWATELKHLPDTDVAAAGGWRDTRALKLSYQQSDPATQLQVVESVG